jgi:hypothetical protein
MRSLYDTLGLTKEATHAEIKKAYHAMCLRLHPDKNPGDEVRALALACAVRLRAHRWLSCRSPRLRSFRRCSACTLCSATLRSGAYAREGGVAAGANVRDPARDCRKVYDETGLEDMVRRDACAALHGR